jgi:hypothetical protein
MVAREASVMLRAFSVRKRTGSIDWLLIALFFISLLSFVGAAILQIDAGAK